MTTKDIKVALHKAVDELPDTVANQALDYLNSLVEKNEQAPKITDNLSKILEEDKELLKRLAK